MEKTIQAIVSPEIAFQPDQLELTIIKKAKLAPDQSEVRLLRRSVDARGKQVKVNVQALVTGRGEMPPLITYKKDFKNVSQAKPIIIVGFGPAGMFAALRLIELGYQPIVIERGSDVRKRRRDIAAINKDHLVNPESNYCFGEGGAGTYSDGKLYTRSKKRGDIQKSLEILVAHGAPKDILIDAHPHIGTNKLPKVVEEMRNTILNSGGTILFDTRVTDFVIKDNRMKGVVLNNGEKLEGLGVILATGHSAVDIYKILNNRKIALEAKPFALGIRIEHPQQLIDQIQYNCKPDRGPWLPAASYALVHQTNFDNKQRGVFSFCMCPGGFIVPSATQQDTVVVNGMSPSRRDSRFANSGIVAAIEVEDYMAEYGKHGALAGVEFQQEIEKRACAMANSTQAAPAQGMIDFVKGRISSQLNETSYQPGLISTNMNDVLPDFVHERLRTALKAFGHKMKGYYTQEAQIVGVESRTSSPVRIPRDANTCEHIQIQGFYPCGEGAGYAGGILSAAMDGEKCADRLVEAYG